MHTVSILYLNWKMDMIVSVVHAYTISIGFVLAPNFLHTRR